jgi:hypothetical protein
MDGEKGGQRMRNTTNEREIKAGLKTKWRWIC